MPTTKTKKKKQFRCLLLNQEKTADRIKIKFNIHIYYNVEFHLGYFLSQKNNGLLLSQYGFMDITREWCLGPKLVFYKIFILSIFWRRHKQSTHRKCSTQPIPMQDTRALALVSAMTLCYIRKRNLLLIARGKFVLTLWGPILQL